MINKIEKRIGVILIGVMILIDLFLLVAMILMIKDIKEGLDETRTIKSLNTDLIAYYDFTFGNESPYGLWKDSPGEMKRISKLKKEIWAEENNITFEGMLDPCFGNDTLAKLCRKMEDKTAK